MLFVNIPGLRNSGPAHWQSVWETQYPEHFIRVQQQNWAAPDCETWITALHEQLQNYRPQDLVLIGHSVGCATIVNWFWRYNQPIKGALLVAPSDVDQPSYPAYITGFAPLPLQKLPFKSIVAASTNDHVVSPERAAFFAEKWGSELHTLENAGHIEDKSGYGSWPEGLQLLHRLNPDFKPRPSMNLV